MSINVTKNKESLEAAWKSVVDDKSPTNWAVYSYEGQTNNLKVVSTGCNGLEEMIEELNSGLIMYAFCRVIDIKTTLPKCVLINWQGEGAPIVRKGTCANHIRDIERVLKGAHITISARCEEDVEVDLIMQKLSRATATSYKFNEPRTESPGLKPIPVGAVYKKVIPEQEINATERDRFWQKEEMEEKQRLELERVRQEKNRQKQEEEVRLREEKENKLREQQIIKAKIQNEAKEERIEEIKNLRKQHITFNNDKNIESDDEHKSRSDELRRFRNQEAQQLISQRTINARAIFERNSSAGQIKVGPIQQHKSNNVDAVRKAFEQQCQVNEPVKTEKKCKPEMKNEKINEKINVPIQESQPPIEPPLSFQTHNNGDLNGDSAQLYANSIIENNIDHNKINVDGMNNMKDDLREMPQLEANNTESGLYSQDNTQYLYLDPNNQGMTARALYDYEAADETEITFDPGDIITHIDAIDEGWWQGLAPDGTYGLFPANHVEVISYGTT